MKLLIISCSLWTFKKFKNGKNFFIKRHLATKYVITDLEADLASSMNNLNA